nr:DUF2283 domain-containing protein [Thiocystis minor]
MVTNDDTGGRSGRGRGLFRDFPGCGGGDTKEIEPDINADDAADGRLVGIEVLSVSTRARLPSVDKVVLTARISD